MSHEIRTPMNTVVLGINLLRKELVERDAASNDIMNILQDITESSEVAIDLVSDLLTHDKIVKGVLTLEKAPTNIWNTVTGVFRPFLVQVIE